MHTLFHGLARFMAYLGGLMLVTLILLTCVSVVGRALNGFFHADLVQGLAPAFADWAIAAGVGPVNGDYELVEAGVAFCIFAFFPLCQMSAGHATVELFTKTLSARSNRILQMVIDIVFAVVLVIIALQLYGGLLTKLRSGQTTFLLEFPVWWAYALSLIGASVAAITGIYVAFVRVLEVVKDTSILSPTLSQGSTENAQH